MSQSKCFSKLRCFGFLVLMLLLITSSVSADPRTDKEVRNAKAFKAEGVSFSTTQKQFVKMFPRAEKSSNSDPKRKITQYYIRGSDSGASYVVFLFVGEELGEIGTTHTKQDIVKKHGSVQAYVTGIQTRFGRADSDSPGLVGDTIKFNWKIDKADKNIHFIQDPDSIMLYVEDLQVAKKIPKD
jgi:hypothetical protein